MVRKGAVLGLALIALANAPSANAGVYTDDLSKCLVSASSPTDKTALMQWMFGVFSLNPAVKPMANVSSAQLMDLDKQAAQMMQRLLLEDCRKQTVDALKYEGERSIQAGFQVLGEVATRGLMTDPAVAAGLQDFGKYIDATKWDALAKEAGAVPPSKGAN